MRIHRLGSNSVRVLLKSVSRASKTLPVPYHEFFLYEEYRPPDLLVGKGSDEVPQSGHDGDHRLTEAGKEVE